MPSDPEVVLMLSVSGGGEVFGPFFAVLSLDKVEIGQLLRRAYVFRTAKTLDHELYQTTYFNYGPQFFESGKTEDLEPADAAKMTAVFEDETYPTDGWRLAAAGEAPERGVVRLDYCKLMVADAGADRPDMVDYRWIACIKHTDVEIETCELKEEDVKALLDKLP